MARIRRWPPSGLLFVLAVTTLTFVAWRDPNHAQREAEVASIGLTLPAFVPLLAVVYGLLAASRNVFHPESGGPAWPVTLVYVAVFAGLALVEVRVVQAIRQGRRSRRDRGPVRWPPGNVSPPSPDERQISPH